MMTTGMRDDENGENYLTKNNYDWDAVKDEHRAMAYAKATLYCWKKMQAAS